MKTKLSICIPTYNRSVFLRECLSSVLIATKGYEDQIEIIISDNASSDDTVFVINEFKQEYPWIRYNRNNSNIGGERNFYTVASLALADYIWIFGDDDKMETEAIAEVLNSIEKGYNLIVTNYSVWSKDLSRLIKRDNFRMHQNKVLTDPNELLKQFGVNLGYISSVIITKEDFLKTSFVEFEKYAEYGFSFLYSVYVGVVPKCHAVYITSQLILNRSGNSGDFDWAKYYVSGTNLIFDTLLLKGYSADAVHFAKHNVLRNYIIPYMFFGKMEDTNISKKNIFSHVHKYYKRDWLFWIVGLPALYTPVYFIYLAKKVVRIARKCLK